MGFLQNSYILIGQLYLYLEFLFIVDFLRWCFTPSLSSPWHGIFYSFILVFIFRIVQLFRCLLWFALASDLPEEHPRVSPKVLLEMYYYIVSTGNVNDNEIWNQA